MLKRVFAIAYGFCALEGFVIAKFTCIVYIP